MNILMRSPLNCSWLAPEVVQTSAMDCGPATLKCLLEGFRIPASYGRLREACQTSVDGTSIDTIETVAQQLGLDAEQLMLPMDYLWIPEAKLLPALIVVRRPDGATHFVVVWKRYGRWLQIMDPAVGRRWTDYESFYKEIFINNLLVPASAWLEWAESEEALVIFRSRLRKLGIRQSTIESLLHRMRGQITWRAMAALDASLRMVQSLINAGGLQHGDEAFCFLESLLVSVAQEDPSVCTALPDIFWSVAPSQVESEEEELMFAGAVLLRIKGRLPLEIDSDLEEIVTPELVASITNESVRPAWALWSMVPIDGVLSPLALIGAIGLAMGALIIEALLFRGFIDLGGDLNIVNQRIAAFAALLFFMLLLWIFELPIISESRRLGRHLESRFRLALMKKLPLLNDRYFHSRPVSDMAERSHSIYSLRNLPDQVIGFVKSGWALIFTLVGIGFIAPQSTIPAIGVAGIAVALSLLVQPWMSELDLKLRSHTGALQTYYLDALLGIVPIRTHSAERSVRRGHEALLTKWARSAKHPLYLSLFTEAVRSISCYGLAGWLLFVHIETVGITGNLLLMVYWVLKLPDLGGNMAAFVLQYPTQRNIALRLLEPINALEESYQQQEDTKISPKLEPAPPTQQSSTPKVGMAIDIQGASVLAGGHTILQNVDIKINPGEHIAIVGPSGAGKSSLLGLLLGWHQPCSGQILTDGAPLNKERLTKLRRETAWIDPAIQIWNRSLLDNLRYNPLPGLPSDLGNILEQADLAEILTHWPEGLQTSLGEGGANISGGEGQRVRLGRAMWQKGVRLVLLDEPFRGLDRERRTRHLTQVRNFWLKATLICVTHDVAETQSFDRVIIVENGNVVEAGTPSILFEKPNSRYRYLLDKEASLRKNIWNAALWRRIRLTGGRLKESSKSVDDSHE